jgi:hypothetical protein
VEKDRTDLSNKIIADRSREIIEEKKELDIFFNNENKRITVINENQYELNQGNEYKTFRLLDSSECLEGINEILKFIDFLSHTEGGEEKNFRDILGKTENMTLLEYTDQKMKGLKRKIDDAANWLICVADNSIAIENSNLKINTLFTIFSTEMEIYLRSLSTGMADYTEKHSMFLQAMNEFTPRIEKIKNDFIQKELFIAKGFTNHLINTLSTEMTFYKVCLSIYLYEYV